MGPENCLLQNYCIIKQGLARPIAFNVTFGKMSYGMYIRKLMKLFNYLRSQKENFVVDFLYELNG